MACERRDRNLVLRSRKKHAVDLRGPRACCNYESSAFERPSFPSQSVFKFDRLELAIVSSNNGNWAGRLMEVDTAGKAGRQKELA